MRLRSQRWNSRPKATAWTAEAQSASVPPASERTPLPTAGDIAMVKPTADFELFVQKNKRIIGNLDEEGLVDFKINTEGSGVSGTDVFRQMMQHFGDKPNGVWGKWVRGTNLDRVNQLTAQGIALEEAVTHAWTANRAREFGVW